MPHDLTPAQVALLLSIDEATWPRSSPGRGLTVPASSDRTRLAVEGLIACSRGGRLKATFTWHATERGKRRADRAREEERERRAAAP